MVVKKLLELEAAKAKMVEMSQQLNSQKGIVDQVQGMVDKGLIKIDDEGSASVVED